MSALPSKVLWALFVLARFAVRCTGLSSGHAQCLTGNVAGLLMQL